MQIPASSAYDSSREVARQRGLSNESGTMGIIIKRYKSGSELEEGGKAIGVASFPRMFGLIFAIWRKNERRSI